MQHASGRGSMPVFMHPRTTVVLTTGRGPQWESEVHGSEASNRKQPLGPSPRLAPSENGGAWEEPGSRCSGSGEEPPAFGQAQASSRRVGGPHGGRWGLIWSARHSCRHKACSSGRLRSSEGPTRTNTWVWFSDLLGFVGAQPPHRREKACLAFLQNFTQRHPQLRKPGHRRRSTLHAPATRRAPGCDGTERGAAGPPGRTPARGSTGHGAVPSTLPRTPLQDGGGVGPISTNGMGVLERITNVT